MKSIAWHPGPQDNTISLTNSDGELVTLPDVVPPDQEALLHRPLQPAPLLDDMLEVETAGVAAGRRLRHRSLSHDSVDELMPLEDIEDDFIVDDDHGGYAEPTLNNSRKRRYDFLDDHISEAKRRAYDAWSPEVHEPFQPGSTPWQGGRKYLALNLTGFVWTVDQGTHNTVTVEFYDRDMYRDFHFTDPYLYDKACLSEAAAHLNFASPLTDSKTDENGALFSSAGTNIKRANLFYRPHETWSTRADWRIQLPEGEDINCTLFQPL